MSHIGVLIFIASGEPDCRVCNNYSILGITCDLDLLSVKNTVGIETYEGISIYRISRDGGNEVWL